MLYMHGGLRSKLLGVHAASLHILSLQFLSQCWNMHYVQLLSFRMWNMWFIWLSQLRNWMVSERCEIVHCLLIDISTMQCLHLSYCLPYLQYKLLSQWYPVRRIIDLSAKFHCFILFFSSSCASKALAINALRTVLMVAIVNKSALIALPSLWTRRISVNAKEEGWKQVPLLAIAIV